MSFVQNAAPARLPAASVKALLDKAIAAKGGLARLAREDRSRRDEIADPAGAPR